MNSNWHILFKLSKLHLRQYEAWLITHLWVVWNSKRTVKEAFDKVTASKTRIKIMEFEAYRMAYLF